MRVLTVGNMYPGRGLTGGYELVWRSAVEHLRANGHEVRVLTTRGDADAASEDLPGVHRELGWYWRDHAFPKLAPWRLAALERGNAAILERHLADLRPDVVSWWAMGGMSLSLIERVRRRRIPAVAFVHDDWLDYGRHVDHWLRSFGGRKRIAGPLAERLTGVPWRIDLAGAARYVFVSDAVRRRALSAVPDLAKTGVAHSGIDPRFIDPAPVQPWQWRLLYVGRLDTRKGIDTAISVLPALPDVTRLTIVGTWDDRERDRLIDLTQRLHVGDRVAFEGQRDRSELPAVYDAADAIVFPVRWEEPWGLVPLEAMARGRPVAATGRGGSAEYLVDGENCVLFDADDPASLAAALRRLAEDPDLRERLREDGVRTAKGHTEDAFNAAVERELRAAVA